MIITYKVAKVSLFDNRATRYTAAQVKAKTGADIVFNGGFFDFKTLQPYCPLRISGTWIRKEKWNCFGYAWDNGDMPEVNVSDCTGKMNFLSCLWAILNGEKQPLHYNSDVGGKRGRTAFGFKADGSMVILCTSDSTEPMTPEQARDKLFDNGCVSGIVLDGGGSSQIITPTETIRSTRIVSNFVCVWLDKPDSNGDKNSTENITKGGDTLNIIQPNYKWARAAVIRKETKYIVLHHVGAKGSFTPEQIHAKHLKKGWRGIGYNFYVRKDGTMYHGREENAAGGHTLDYNEVSIGICFEGNFEEETMTDAQKKSGQELLVYLTAKYPTAKVVRHRELNATACPGKLFPFADITTIPKAETPKTNKVYRVQVGAFGTREGAEKYAKELQTKGYKPFVVEENV